MTDERSFDQQREDELNPEYPDPLPTETEVIGRALAGTATDEEKARAQAAWDALPDWRKQDIEDEYELDLL